MSESERKVRPGAMMRMGGACVFMVRIYQYQVGDVVYGIPRHICPAVALHSAVWAVRDGAAAESWAGGARARRITV